MKFLTIEDLTERFHTTKAAIYAMRRKHQLPAAYVVGRRLLWAEEDIEEWLESRREPGPAPVASISRRSRRSRQAPKEYPWLGRGEPRSS